MYKENTPSLLLPKLVALLFVAVFFTGVVEIICLATSVQKSNYSFVKETTKFISQHEKSEAPTTQLLPQGR